MYLLWIFQYIYSVYLLWIFHYVLTLDIAVYLLCIFTLDISVCTYFGYFSIFTLNNSALQLTFIVKL